MIFMKDIKTSHRSSLAEENRLRVTAVQASYQAAVLSHVASMCDTRMGCPRDHLVGHVTRPQDGVDSCAFSG